VYEYKATIASAAAVHDGDTIRVLLDQGLREYRDMAIRFFGINAPELRTPEGIAARLHLLTLLGTPFPVRVVVRTIKDAADKYGERWDGKVWLESLGTWGPDYQFLPGGPSLNDQMVTDGFAVVYP
jgi:endonuclease YncB( thermonuclease family)